METIVLVTLFSISAYAAREKAYLENMDGVDRVYFFPPVGTNLVGRGFVFPYDFFFFPINVKYFFFSDLPLHSLSVGSASLLLAVLLTTFEEKSSEKIAIY